jgi:hypothetical protein
MGTVIRLHYVVTVAMLHVVSWFLLSHHVVLLLWSKLSHHMWCYSHVIALCGVAVMVAVVPCDAIAMVIIMVALLVALW